MFPCQSLWSFYCARPPKPQHSQPTGWPIRRGCLVGRRSLRRQDLIVGLQNWAAIAPRNFSCQNQSAVPLQSRNYWSHLFLSIGLIEFKRIQHHFPRGNQLITCDTIQHRASEKTSHLDFLHFGAYGFGKPSWNHAVVSNCGFQFGTVALVSRPPNAAR